LLGKKEKLRQSRTTKKQGEITEKRLTRGGESGAFSAKGKNTDKKK